MEAFFVLYSDTGLYIDALGGLPGPYNAYFDKQIGIDLFLNMLKDIKNRQARIEHCFAYCAPNEKAIVFSGGGKGTLSFEPRGELGRWHDKFFIPNGQTKTLSELRAINKELETSFWGTAKDDFALWYQKNKR